MKTLEALLAAKTWLEEDLWASETLIADQDFPAIWHLIVHLTGFVISRLFEPALEICDNISHRLLDVLHDVRLRLVVEDDTTLLENLAHVVGQVTTTKRDLDSGVRDGVTFKSWHNMRDALS